MTRAAYVGGRCEGPADAVVVGGGTIGGWCAWFLRRAGLDRVVLVEADTLGQGASSRAAGMVRAQGGTETAVRLGLWTRDFYAGQRDAIGIDSGFVVQGYLMPCFTEAEVEAAQARIAMQQDLGLQVGWITSDEVDVLNPNLAAGRTRGASYAPGDGYLDPPRNVLAYTVAAVTAGVEVHERTAFTGLRTAGGRVTGVETTGGTLETGLVVLTGGPQLAEVGRAAGVRIPSGGARHQVVVTEPHPDLAPDRVPMVFDVASGIYWRPCEGGLLWGMSNPDESPGVATRFDDGYFATMRARVGALLPVTANLGIRKTWAATIDFTPDHLPILGPGLDADGVVEGTTVAAAGGHGMMWGPAVARAAVDLALAGKTEVVDVSDLGLDRFDAQGRSRLAADPIALPFPENALG
ncbi:MAG: NAD(P)/FAD-dependent oxidoreductase [Actinomycetes bacterium]